MENPQTIKELFLPLAVKLLPYETGNYLWENPDFDIIDYGLITGDSEVLMKEITLSAGLFEDEREVFNEANTYLKRVDKVYHKLRPIKYSEDYPNTSSGKNLKDVSEEFLRLWKLELDTYANYLRVIRDTASLNIESDTKHQDLNQPKNTVLKRDTIPDTQIQHTTINYLPEKFKVADYKGTFVPKMTRQEAALFFRYMMDLKIMPPYDNKGVSLLATPYFCVSNQSVRNDLGNIHDIKLEKLSLSALKERLQSVIDEIDKDLPKAK